MLASDDTGCYLLRTPRLQLVANGAGDTVAALFLAHYLRQVGAKEALARAGNSIFGILQKTLDAGAAEIQVVLGQDEVVQPSSEFDVEQLVAPPLKRTERQL